MTIARLDSNDNCNGDCSSKKRCWTREKERGNLKMGLFFCAVLFCYYFLAFFFQCRLIEFLLRSSQLLDGLLLQDFTFSYSNLVVELLFIKFKLTIIGYLLQDFSSSHPNLVITFLFGNYSVRVNCRE